MGRAGARARAASRGGRPQVRHVFPITVRMRATATPVSSRLAADIESDGTP
jgi:hypothetical protein